MVSPKSKRIMITINKDLDAAIDEFLEKSGATLQIHSKSHLFTIAIVDFFAKLEETIQKSIDSNAKKGD